MVCRTLLGLICGAVFAGCGGGGVLGVAPTDAPVTVATARRAPVGQPITVAGVMIER
jgi:multidrug efflux pump subunit AcrA (membrane-fusion protein)